MTIVMTTGIRQRNIGNDRFFERSVSIRPTAPRLRLPRARRLRGAESIRIEPVDYRDENSLSISLQSNVFRVSVLFCLDARYRLQRSDDSHGESGESVHCQNKCDGKNRGDVPAMRRPVREARAGRREVHVYVLQMVSLVIDFLAAR